MKIAFITDTHAGVRNNAKVFMKNSSDFYEKTFFPELQKRGIDTIIHGGDFFDNRKTLNVEMIKNIKETFLDKLVEYDMKMFIILGNHDVTYKNTNDINSVELILSPYKNIKIVSQPETLEFDGQKFDFIPWISSEDTYSVNFIKKSSSPVCIGHFDIVGFEMEKGMLSSHGLDKKLFRKYEMVLSGHYHNKSNQDNITYTGAPFEFTWNDEGIPKYFHIIDTADLSLEPIRNPSTIFRKVYYNDEFPDNLVKVSDLTNMYVKLIVIKNNDQTKLNAYLEKLQKSEIIDLKVLENFSTMLVADDVENGELLTTEEIIYKYIDNVDTDKLDREKLKKMINALYNEANLLDLG